MNTLTNFINFNLNNNPTTHNDSLHQVEATQSLDHAQYEVIENELIDNTEFNKLTVSGSLFSLTTFRNVTFESCVFYGSKFENCKFENCKFVNCSFSFSNISYCNFKSTEFQEMQWDFSPIHKSQLQFCTLDGSTHQFSTKGDNSLWNCTFSSPLSWEDVLLGQQNGQEGIISQETEDEETKTHFFGSVIESLKKIAA